MSRLSGSLSMCEVSAGPVLIRTEEENDRDALHVLNASAFDAPAEADLVDELRKLAKPIVSLVAEDSGTVVGHIMFSPVSLMGHSDLKIMGMTPMAVAPEHQSKGVGSALVRS
jgi:putative acetyltransferase